MSGGDPWAAEPPLDVTVTFSGASEPGVVKSMSMSGRRVVRSYRGTKQWHAVRAVGGAHEAAALCGYQPVRPDRPWDQATRPVRCPRCVTLLKVDRPERVEPAERFVRVRVETCVVCGDIATTVIETRHRVELPGRQVEMVEHHSYRCDAHLGSIGPDPFS